MSNFAMFLKDRRKVILLVLILIASYSLVCSVSGVSFSVISYSILVVLCIGIIEGIFDFYKYNKSVNNLKENVGNICFDNSFLERGEYAKEDLYVELIDRLFFEIKDEKQKHDDTYREMIEYYTMWAHQIKTPIAALKLILDTDFDGPKTALKMELFKVEQYVEMVLQYLRLGSEQTDYVFESCDLLRIVRDCVKKFSYTFIHKKLSLDIRDFDLCVVTDEKWISFVIEQVISNALKYTSKGKISIYMQQPETLVIEDTGIGIKAEDIPRVWEKGYTGYTGRLEKQSTGIGLYLCREIISKLNHKIDIESEPGKGTKVRISFAKNPERGYR